MYMYLCMHIYVFVFFVVVVCLPIYILWKTFINVHCLEFSFHQSGLWWRILNSPLKNLTSESPSLLKFSSMISSYKHDWKQSECHLEVCSQCWYPQPSHLVVHFHGISGSHMHTTKLRAIDCSKCPRWQLLA